ncbi:MAG TPA: hypothetical protein VMG12_03335, partial [Polyangiaceae bacterium]|nr:hypothetical protein [Polyangiaceae bacterium]
MSAWRAESESLTLVTDGSELPRLIAEAAAWAERITLCVSAPQSERGTASWWRELFARSSKLDGVYVRQAQRGEGWLLHRLHALGALRLVEGGGKQVASNLWMFARGDELRVVLTHIPLERAAAGATFGALLAFRGRQSGELGRACRAQRESWADLARIPTGSEVDALTLDARRRGALPAVDAPRAASVIVEPAALSTGLERFAAASGAAHAASSTAGSHAAPFNAGSFNAGSPSPLLPNTLFNTHAPDTTLSVRAFAGGYRVALGASSENRFALTLYNGAAWGAGNALLVDDGAGGSLLVWRGGLLGPSRSRAELFWSEARFPTIELRDVALGLEQRVAVVARSGAPLEPQLAAFMRELERLSEAFGVEPPPALGHVLADFSTLSARQQTLLIGRALIGSGTLELSAATSAAAAALRDQGYLRGQSVAPGSVAHGTIAELLSLAADEGNGFDRPTPETLRATQQEASAYVLDDWLECLLLALPGGRPGEEAAVVEQRVALRLAFDHARERWGLGAGRDAVRLSRGGSVERAIEGALSTALWRGLVLRVGAG